jgi:hypothetical protein
MKKPYIPYTRPKRLSPLRPYCREKEYYIDRILKMCDESINKNHETKLRPNFN